MADRPDKPKVVDEVWDDDRVRSFLHADATDASASFYVLLRAYRGMRAHDFERFITLFVESGGDLDARDEQGQSLVDVIASHRHARPFIDVMLAAGAAPVSASNDDPRTPDRAASAPGAAVQGKS